MCYIPIESTPSAEWLRICLEFLDLRHPMATAKLIITKIDFNYKTLKYNMYKMPICKNVCRQKCCRVSFAFEINKVRSAGNSKIVFNYATIIQQFFSQFLSRFSRGVAVPHGFFHAC